MTSSLGAPSAATPAGLRDPRTATGAPPDLGSPADVDAVMPAAREAARWWAGRSFAQRREALLRFKREIAAGADDLIATMCTEAGKPHDDALLEVLLTLEHLDWAARHAEAVLRRRSVRPGLLAFQTEASVGYEPYGVIGVIGPWNYPLYTPSGSISYALAAGNAVVFKPSEYTPGVGLWLAAAWQRANPGRAVLSVVTGGGAVGARLLEAGVDKLAFTGSTATAKKIMAAASATLTPILAECGGKDPLIVAADADLARAADAVVLGGFGNSGQTCVGVERVYVVESVAEEFLAVLTDLVRGLRPGDGPDAPYGPMVLPQGPQVVADQVAEALAAGGRAVVGGTASVRPPYVDPIVLVDVPEDTAAVRTETFGPMIVVNRVASLDEAVSRANATAYGLGATVFTRDVATGRRLAERLRAGMVSINSVLGFAPVPTLPFGGRGDSGFGRIHGADGLREFAVAKSVARQRFVPPVDLLRHRRAPRDIAIARALITHWHARR